MGFTKPEKPCGLGLSNLLAGPVGSSYLVYIHTSLLPKAAVAQFSYAVQVTLRDTFCIASLRAVHETPTAAIAKAVQEPAPGWAVPSDCSAAQSSKSSKTDQRAASQDHQHPNKKK